MHQREIMGNWDHWDHDGIDQQPLQVFSVEELTEWAVKERLGARFKGAIPEIVQMGGLHILNNAVLVDLGIALPALRIKVMESVRTKLAGCRQIRWGQIEYFDSILRKKPSLKCPWCEIDEIEVRHDKMALKAAVTTWKFMTTGFDGLERESLMRKAFDAMRPKRQARGVDICRAMTHPVCHSHSPSKTLVILFDELYPARDGSPK